jgi:4-diphosphocytidyl-2-C-methyl-D-erythritol kinase
MKCLIECRAKVNLYLGVTGRREDGYHEIETVYQPVSISDMITIQRADSGIDLSGSDDSIRWDETNLCHRAASEILAHAGYGGGVRIDVDKRIPHGAGLGGGSSDAAGVLVGLNTFLNLDISSDRLLQFALDIGSDVPFFIFNRPAVGRGRGEILEPFRGMKGIYILLVIPEIRINTGEAYKKIDLMLTKDQSRFKLSMFSDGLSRIPRGKIQSYNSFEEPMGAEHPEIKEILDLLRMNENSVFSSLSGSGSVCFSVFEQRREADEELEFISGKGYNALVVEPREKSIELEC